MTDTIQPVSAESRFQRRNDVIHSDVDDTVLALAMDSGDCFSFTGPSGRLWHLLEQPISPADAADILVAEYAVDARQCLDEVAEFFGRLRGEGLISAVADPQ